jgi:hypothetical protein
MFDGSESEGREDRDTTAPGTPEAGDQAAGGKPGEEGSGSLGGEGQESPGADNAEATPKIGEEGEKGQTAVPAPDDDVGGAEDEDDRTE